jgi:hypothetical protein
MYRKHPPVSGGKRTGTVRPGRASCFQATPEVSAAALACPVRVPSRSGGQGARLDGPDRRCGCGEKTSGFICLCAYSKSVTTTSILPRRRE